MVDNAAQGTGNQELCSASGTTKRHPSYYIKDDPIVILGQDKVVEGLTDDNPFYLHGVACKDFERLLCLFYPDDLTLIIDNVVVVATNGAGTASRVSPIGRLVRGYGPGDVLFAMARRCLTMDRPHRNVSDGDLSTTEEWTSVLALATKWEFADYRQLAISRLAQLASPIDRILLGRSYDIPEWIAAAYLELCKRDDALTYEEGARLGMHDAILLSDIRQCIRGNRVTTQEKNILLLIEKKLV
ncbi:hypothetical protein EVJ58_g4699 [Rhodofomes roseus]|uniref:Uncharacterized protein n=1 Tax=Rhodofomes roseus TaxID=34475 RepID=A0A4Y9YGL5_9APHY|nr:hypothetical protein EVJ58_g4699 [Rhodofomes roseus]